jgi:Mrp family chromosome partitioning ATPase
VLLVAPGEAGARPRIALNLALSAAGAGGNVLLVEADAGELTKRLDVQRSPGLADVAEHRVGFHDALLAEPRTGLLALAAGRSQGEGGDDAELAEKIVKVLTNARSFDLLVLDGPSTRSGTLARALAVHADAVFLVITAGRTRRVDIVDALARAELPPSKLRGAIFVEPGRSP